MKQYIIGVDTGGTCTDAVLIDIESKQIHAVSKVKTTSYRLSEGIGHALSTLLEQKEISPDQVHSVAISTTLATNSVVEKKGARVGLFVIGYVKHFKLPVTAIMFLKGGHTIQGVEEEPLELEYLVDTLALLKNEVDAYAVCSAMSMVNPTHELVAEKAIRMIDPKPVFCSHLASSEAGMKERSATAALHAKLMPLMNSFIENVGQAFEQRYLTCPFTIITGDAGTIAPEKAIHNSGITVASGPACSALFGSRQTRRTALVVDVGGTTTDIAIVENGTPVCSTEGCTIDSWTTHIPSIDIHTGGIGGDSLVTLKSNGTFTVGPSRVVPLCMNGLSLESADWLGQESAARAICPAPHIPNEVKDTNRILHFLDAQAPAPPSAIAQALGIGIISLERQLEELARKQLILETGFTPTDALHVLGQAGFGSTRPAAEGAAALARHINTDSESFCRQVIDQTIDQIASLIVSSIAERSWDNSLKGVLSSCRNHPLLDLHFTLKVPIIGLGAASRFLLPGVAERLGTSVEFPDHFEVGNAIGAALCQANQVGRTVHEVTS